METSHLFEFPDHHQHTTRWAALVAAGFVLAALLVIAIAANARAADREHKVTICHATHSATNPYVEITVDYHSIVGRGHGSHDGDVIPAFDFGPGAQYSGQNMGDEGIVLLANGCASGPSSTTTTTDGGGPIG